MAAVQMGVGAFKGALAAPIGTKIHINCPPKEWFNMRGETSNGGYDRFRSFAERYREPTENVAPIIPAMRRASMTVAGALMCPEIKDTDPKRILFVVEFVVNHDDRIYSKPFGLL